MALTTKQQAFVEAYLANGFNATKAAITAGYSAKTARSIGSENLTKPDIVSRVRARMTEMAMDADEAMARLSEHARGDLGEFIGLGDSDLSNHPQSHLLRKHKRTIRTTKDGERIETIEVELHDPQSALVTILKEQHLRKGEATEITDDASLSDADRAARIAALFERARARRDGHASGVGGGTP